MLTIHPVKIVFACWIGLIVALACLDDAVRFANPKKGAIGLAILIAVVWILFVTFRWIWRAIKGFFS